LLKKYIASKMKKLSVKCSIEINAPASKIWQAFTDPAMIKEYLFGTDATSDWKQGSAITYRGEWKGKTYEDKGTIVEIVPEKLLHTTYWSGMSGKEDKPENYANVIYEIKPEADHQVVSITQDNIDDEAGIQHMRENWGMVLKGMKELLEK